MERLILIYQNTDNFTYWSDETVPLLYKNKEAAISDLETKIIEYILDETKQQEFTFSNLKLTFTNFIDYSSGKAEYKTPRILTLDEWFGT